MHFPDSLWSKGGRRRTSVVNDNSSMEAYSLDKVEQVADDEIEERFWLPVVISFRFGCFITGYWPCQKTENAYGAFIHTALQTNVLRAILFCGPMLTASVVLQVMLSFSIWMTRLAQVFCSWSSLLSFFWLYHPSNNKNSEFAFKVRCQRAKSSCQGILYEFRNTYWLCSTPLSYSFTIADRGARSFHHSYVQQCPKHVQTCSNGSHDHSLEKWHRADHANRKTTWLPNDYLHLGCMDRSGHLLCDSNLWIPLYHHRKDGRPCDQIDGRDHVCSECGRSSFRSHSLPLCIGDEPLRFWLSWWKMRVALKKSRRKLAQQGIGWSG